MLDLWPRSRFVIYLFIVYVSVGDLYRNLLSFSPVKNPFFLLICTYKYVLLLLHDIQITFSLFIYLFINLFTKLICISIVCMYVCMYCMYVCIVCMCTYLLHVPDPISRYGNIADACSKYIKGFLPEGLPLAVLHMWYKSL